MGYFVLRCFVFFPAQIQTKYLNFRKIGHRNRIIKVRKVWFLLNKLQLNLTHFKRNQTLLSLIELFLWPIFSKIDLRGVRISAPPKNKLSEFEKKTIGTIYSISASKWAITQLYSIISNRDKWVGSNFSWLNLMRKWLIL